MKVVINKCFGGFGLSEAAYAKLIEWGVPVRKYVEQERDEETGRYRPQPLNDGEVIFDRELTARGESASHDRMYWAFKDKYGSEGVLTGRYLEIESAALAGLGVFAFGMAWWLFERDREILQLEEMERFRGRIMRAAKGIEAWRP